MNQYEAMFLFDPTFGGSFENCEAEIRRVMDRAGADIVLCRKWDERRLAYRVRGRKRGVYVLTYFKASPDKIASLERDVHLAEDILRVLVVRADDATLETMERAVATHGAETMAPGGRDGSGEGESAPSAPPAAPPAAVGVAAGERPEAAVVPDVDVPVERAAQEGSGTESAGDDPG